MSDELEPVDENQYPAIEAAYAMVVPSYQMMAGRFEAADNRLSALVTLATQVTLGVPIFGKAIRPNIEFGSPLLVIAVGLFAVSAVGGVLARSWGAVTLPNPRRFHDTCLHLSDKAFKRSALYFAGVAFDANAAKVRRKGNAAAAVTIGLILEVVALVTWLAV